MSQRPMTSRPTPLWLAQLEAAQARGAAWSPLDRCSNTTCGCDRPEGYETEAAAAHLNVPEPSLWRAVVEAVITIVRKVAP